MKFILILMLLMAAHCHAGWFHDDYMDRWQQSEEQLEHQRQATGDWQIIAGVLAVGAVILFVVGTTLGSKIRRETRKEAQDD